MEVIQIVATITSSENINLFVIAICGVHVAGARRCATGLEVQPSEVYEVQDVHVIRSQRPLP